MNLTSTKPRLADPTATDLPEIQTDPRENPILSMLGKWLATPFYAALSNLQRRRPQGEEALPYFMESVMGTFGPSRWPTRKLGTREGLLQSMVDRVETYKGELTPVQRQQEAIRLEKVLRMMEGKLPERISAEFIGYQQPLKATDKPVALYNIIGGSEEGMTVSLKTLQQKGIKPPKHRLPTKEELTPAFK